MSLEKRPLDDFLLFTGQQMPVINLGRYVEHRMDLLEEKLDKHLAVAEIIARLFESDCHSWSTRPCATCNEISKLLGRPFGCIARAELAKTKDKSYDH